MSECLTTSLEHLLAELRRVELKLHLEVTRMRRESVPPGDDRFRGLYISEQEIDHLTDGLPLLQTCPSSGQTNPEVHAPTNGVPQLETHSTVKKEESPDQGSAIRLHNVASLFDLSAFDVDTMLLCILPELDLRYQRLYAYLQDDVTKKSPTVDLVLRLLAGSFLPRLKARDALSLEAPLIRHHVVRFLDEPGQRTTPLLARALRVDERIMGYLLGSDQIDARLQLFAHMVDPKLRLHDIILPSETMNHLGKLVASHSHEGIVCHLQGPYGVGKQATAEAVCSELERPMLVVDTDRMLASDEPVDLLARLIFREGRLQDAALYFNGCDSLLGEEKTARPGYESIIAELKTYSHWVFLSGEREWQPGETLCEKPFVDVELTMPSYLERLQLWERQRGAQETLTDDISFADLAGRFRLTGGQISDVLTAARSLALWRDSDHEAITASDLYAACRSQFRATLKALAHKVQPKFAWDDIVLPRDQIEQLREICGYVEHYHTVYDAWGFDDKLATGRGLNALFAGPSGTGKTMAAEIIAAELGLDLYKIDLSAIVSKYIGETEKNLDRIFREAQTSNAILFFDEADALFGKRSEVRDSHDRYANIETAYLLQKMDEYEGVVILATNLRKNMDDAFARRMHFAIEFPFPEETDRYRIWQHVFPSAAPLVEDVDLGFLARQFRITGGNIKNIALGAAFLAAQDGGRITMEYLIRATKREYQKMGKLCTEGDFAQYFEMVKA